MRVLEKIKRVYLCQVPTFKIEMISFFDHFTFIFSFTSVSIISIFGAGMLLNYIYVVPGRTSALVLSLGTIVIWILIWGHIAYNEKSGKRVG